MINKDQYFAILRLKKHIKTIIKLRAFIFQFFKILSTKYPNSAGVLVDKDNFNFIKSTDTEYSFESTNVSIKDIAALFSPFSFNTLASFEQHLDLLNYFLEPFL